jgi:hypothetical protein
METTRSVISPGTGTGNPSRSRAGEEITLVAVKRPVGAPLDVPHGRGEGGPDVALVGVGAVQPADLQRDHALFAEVDVLDDLALVEVPDVDRATVAAGGQVLQVEAVLEGAGRGPLAGDQVTVAGVVPEVVVPPRGPVGLPAALDLEGLGVQDGEPGAVVAVGVAQHAHDHVVAGHAVDGVGSRQAGPGLELLGLDHLVEAGGARVGGHVDDVDPRGPQAGHDQVAPLELAAVERARAGLPAVVVELVADARHRGAGDDRAVGLRGRVDVDGGQEVRLLDPGAGVEGGDVHDLLPGRPHGVGRGGEAGP